jgi:hypothetical protein
MRRRAIAVCLSSAFCHVCVVLQNRAVAQSPAYVGLSAVGVGDSGTTGAASIQVPSKHSAIANPRVAKAEAVPDGGLTIIPTFDSSITMSPNAQAIESSISDAIGVLEALFSDPITVQIDFQYSTTLPGGQPAALSNSIWGYYYVLYTTYISLLQADSRTTNDVTALDHLPASPLATDVDLHGALGRALGLNTPGFLDSNGATNTGGTFDGIVVLNSSQPLQFNRTGGISPGNYDAQRLVEHEMDEVLGLTSILPATTDASGNSAVEPEDLFRYSSPGLTSLTTSPSATAYFSINGGVSSIVGLNQQSGLDYGDWLSPSCALEAITPLVQYAATCPGTAADVSATSPEGIALDVIGYTLRAATITYTISGTISGAGGNGATVALTGTATATTIANSSGAYSFSGLDDGSYTVTPSLSGYTFEPPSQAVTVSGGNQTANFTASATGATIHLAVIAPSSATTEVPIQFTVTALDVNNNTVTGFTDPVTFTSSDASASLPGNMTLTNGVGVFSARFATAGSQTITATDSLHSAITGTSAPIAVAGCTNEGANWNPSATTISLGSFCFQAGTSITANSGFVVNGTANITFIAGSSITLGPGFDAKGTAGATFTAYVP